MSESRVYSLFDSSRLSTFVISILLIIYGCFRSLNLDNELQEKKKVSSDLEEKENLSNDSSLGSSVQTIDSCQAMFLPVGASVSLLIVFLLFDSLQIVFAICTAGLALISFAFLLLPMCQYLLKSCSNNTACNKISLGCFGRYTSAELLSASLSCAIICIWVMTGHWILMDALGMGLCVAFIALVRLPSLKVSVMLLLGLLLYDVFWVFFSSRFFATNVMVRVATRKAENPIRAIAKKLHLTNLVKNAPKLSLPGKLVFPSIQNKNHFSMLGLGDIVMPGLLLCFVMRFDMYKKSLAAKNVENTASTTSFWQRITYFQFSLFGYFIGLAMATITSEIFSSAQPALLYLVPGTLLPVIVVAYIKDDLNIMWQEPFAQPPSYSQISPSSCTSNLIIVPFEKKAGYLDV